MNVYYFTGAPYGLSNISLQRLKISRFADINDPFELLGADLANAQHRKTFHLLKDRVNESKGIICFSGAWQNPLLWGHYAEKHTGMALGFKVSDGVLAKVDYSSRRVEIEIDENTGKLILDDSHINTLLRTKFRDWKYENEYRLFVELDHTTKESGLYFQDFSDDLKLVEIVLGPRCELPIDKLRAIVAGYDTPVRIIKSRLASRSYRVIEDKGLVFARNVA